MKTKLLMLLFIFLCNNSIIFSQNTNNNLNEPKLVRGNLYNEKHATKIDSSNSDNQIIYSGINFSKDIDKEVPFIFENGRSIKDSSNNNTDGDPKTYFTDYRGNLNQGGSWYQQFTIPSGNVGFVIRLATKYATDAAIFVPAQLNNFINNNAFYGYGVFDDQYGYQYLTMGPGTYYIGVRNQVNESNYASLELDFQISLASNNSQYFTEGISNVTYVQNNSYYWHQFIIQSGYRYFIDGCNSKMDVFIIPFNQINNFSSGNTFQYYIDYSGFNDASQPGFYEINLPVGNYYLAVRNFTGSPQSLVYNTEIWRIVGITNLNTEIPSQFRLSQNYPNPFNPTTKIKFDLKNSGMVKIKVFDLTGKEVATLVNENLNAGGYETEFNGSGLTSGVYFYKIETDNYSEVKKMTLLK